MSYFNANVKYDYNAYKDKITINDVIEYLQDIFSYKNQE